MPNNKATIKTCFLLEMNMFTIMLETTGGLEFYGMLFLIMFSLMWVVLHYNECFRINMSVSGKFALLLHSFKQSIPSIKAEMESLVLMMTMIRMNFYGN